MVPGICSISELSEWAARDFTSERNEKPMQPFFDKTFSLTDFERID